MKIYFRNGERFLTDEDNNKIEKLFFIDCGNIYTWVWNEKMNRYYCIDENWDKSPFVYLNYEYIESGTICIYKEGDTKEKYKVGLALTKEEAEILKSKTGWII
jgi:hypothetical protein